MPRTRKSDAVKLRELEVLQAVVTNPILVYVAGFTAIEVMQKAGIVGEVAGSVAEVGMAPIAVAFAFAPLVPLIPSIISTVAGGLIPLKAAGG